LQRSVTDLHIAIIGAGRIGGNAARAWSRAGHDVRIAFSRKPEQLPARAAELGDHVSAATPVDAVEASDVVMLAVPWDAIGDALQSAGPLAGKVVIDATNPFGSSATPSGGTTAAHFNSARMPGARHVRALNTLTAEFQAEAVGRPVADRAVMFLCGDYTEAKRIVSGLIADAGFAPVDLGAVAQAGLMEPPRRAGAVFGEEYLLPEARALVEGLTRHESVEA
jgi:8-hydroxy-5-deazaflavin:NADPH oxidoreductase